MHLFAVIVHFSGHIIDAVSSGYRQKCGTRSRRRILLLSTKRVLWQCIWKPLNWRNSYTFKTFGRGNRMKQTAQNISLERRDKRHKNSSCPIVIFVVTAPNHNPNRTGEMTELWSFCRHMSPLRLEQQNNCHIPSNPSVVCLSASPESSYRQADVSDTKLKLMPFWNHASLQKSQVS